ncbi:MAG: hypothetical protein WB493_15280 [Anaeromyxobacteraceae bacterium]
MKGALRLLLLLGVGAIGLFFLRGMPRSVTLVYDLEDAPAIRTLEVDIRNPDGALRHAEYRFPDGAPRQVRHDVKLPDGEYEVAVRVAGPSGPARRTVRSVVVSESGPVVLAIAGSAPRAD